MESPEIRFNGMSLRITSLRVETQARLDADPNALIESPEIWFRSNKEPKIEVLPLAKLTRGPGRGSQA